MAIQAAEIVDDVRRVLSEANRGKGAQPQFLTAYQILDRLPRSLRDSLIQERGLPGSGAGVYYAAAGVVKDAILRHMGGEVQVEYLDNVGACFEIAGTEVRAGYPVCGLYRLLTETGADV